MANLHQALLIALLACFNAIPSTSFSFSHLQSTRFIPLKSSVLVKGFLDDFLPTIGAKKLDKEREELKDTLLEECRRPSDRKDKRNRRSRIERLIKELALVSPIDATASSDLLQRKWLLEWTTEKEINIFVDWGVSGDITQDIRNNLLENEIEFKKGGGLQVKGELSIPDSDGKRTNFKFQSATLDLGKWGSYNVPPVGAGWFDTVYLDSELRVDCNSRNDILICTPANE